MHPTRAPGAALIVIAVGAVFLGLAVQLTGVVHRFELQTVDLRFAVRGERPAPKDIVVVAVDESTFRQLGIRWPFPRSLHARVIDNLRAAGAEVIAYDIEFTEPTKGREDIDLARAINRAPHVVLATENLKRDGSSPVIFDEDQVARGGAPSGLVNFPLDAGGIYRRVNTRGGRLDAFGPLVAKQTARRPIEAPRDRAAWIDYAGPPGTFMTIPYWRVLRGRYEAPAERTALRGSTVIVGATVRSLGDVHGTSTGAEQMSGPEINANVVATARAGYPLDETPGWVNTMLVVLLGVTPPAGAGLLGRRLAGPGSGRVAPTLAIPAITLIGSLLLGAGFAFAAQLLFNGGAIVAVVAPLVALLVAIVGTQLVQVLSTVIERARIRDSFARFVPEEVVELVINQAGGDLRLGGVEKTCSVLFSDIRGFTTFSEKHPPDRVLEILNRYLSEMSDAIFASGGTLTAFIGDGIMAVFGAPVDQPDHADRAVEAAQAMAGDRLASINGWLAEQGIEPFSIGVGVNTGPLMVGNVGSDKRMDYTAIGDTVNCASRIEGMTKTADQSALIADSTREALTRIQPELVEVGELPVRGRETAIKLWGMATEG